MPDEFINVEIKVDTSGIPKGTRDVEAIDAAIQRLKQSAERLRGVGVGLGLEGIGAAKASVNETTNAITGLTNRSVALKAAMGDVAVSVRETTSALQQMKAATAAIEPSLAAATTGLGRVRPIGESTTGLSGALYRRQLEQQLAVQAQAERANATFNAQLQQGIASRQAAEAAVRIRELPTPAVRPIGETFRGMPAPFTAGGVSGALFRRQLEQQLGAQAQAQLAEQTFNAQMRQQISTRQAIRPDVFADLQRRAGFQGGRLLQSTIELTPQLDKQGQVIGQNARALIDLGNGQTRVISTTNQLTESFSRVGRQLAGIAVGMLVWRGVSFVTQSIEEIIDAQVRYSIETARFAAVTEQSIGSAVAQYNRLQQAAAMRGVLPSEAAPGIRLASQFTKVREEQEKIIDVSSRISQAFGADPARVAEQVITSLRQWQLDASQVDRIGDLIANTYGQLPGTIDDITASLEEAIPIASTWGTTVEQSFAILIQAGTAASESPTLVSNALGRITDGLLDIDRGGRDAFERSIRLSREFGLEIEDAEGNLRPIPELFVEIGQALQGLQPAERVGFLELITGAQLRPAQLRTLIAAFTSFAGGINEAGDTMAGALDSYTEKVQDSFGNLVNMMRANGELIQQQGDVLTNLLNNLLTSVAPSLGVQGVQFAQQFQQTVLAPAGAQGAGADQLQKFLEQGLRGEDLRRAVQEHNERVTRAIADQMQNLPADLLAPAKRIYIESIGRSLTITDAEMAEALRFAGTPPSVSRGLTAAQRQQGMAQFRASETGRPVETFLPPPPRVTPPTTGMEQVDVLGEQFTKLIEGGEFDLFSSVIDATKFSMEEIADARAIAAQLAEAELQFQIGILQAHDVSNEKIQEYIEHWHEVNDLSLQVLQTQRGFMEISGPETRFLQDALRQQQEAGRRKESDFAFRRLRDVEPAQFSQLQALTSFYNQMLSNLGSPEEPRRINVLLGQEGVLRQLNGRMTALQLALEDLTKVEKAQLSGTWNLPSGATALVPISSLDIQRWNAQGAGGGMSAEAMAALLAMASQLGTGQGGGGGGGGGFGVAPRQIPPDMAAIGRNVATAVLAGLLAPIGARVPSMRAVTPEEEPDRFRAPRPGFGARQQEFTQQRAGQDRVATTLEFIVSRFAQARTLGMGGRGLGVGFGGDGADGRRPTITPTVTVNPTPIRAQFTANINVMMNGQVLARALYNMIYQQILRLTRAGPGNTSNRSLGSVR